MKRLIIILICLFSFGLGFAQESEIDTTTAINAANFFASQKWDDIELDNYDVVYDLKDDSKLAFIFTFRKTDSQFLQENPKQKLTELKYLIDENRDNESNTIEFKRITSQFKEYLKKTNLIYRTVVISANKDLPPLISRSEGLHNIYINQESQYTQR
jgi:hypothetical protein